MAAPSYLTWDGDPPNSVVPRRPSTDDVGGDAKVDDANYPPDEDEDPTAAGWNQKAKQIPALAKSAAVAVLYVKFTAGDPVIQQASGPGAAVVPALFTPTDNADGDTTIAWPADSFPTSVCAPAGFTLIGSAAPTTGFSHRIEVLTNSIRVRTWDGTTPTDMDFTLMLF